MSRARSRACCAVLLGLACGDPEFVSLGRNLQSVAGGPDAGSPSAGEPAISACEPAQAASDLPDDVLSPIDPGELDCELPVPVGCPLTGESEPIDAPCEQRQLVPCREPGRLLFDVLAGCTELSYQLTVHFESGCATAFRIDALEALASPSSVQECVAAHLAAERYDCEQTIGCAIGSTFPRITR